MISNAEAMARHLGIAGAGAQIGLMQLARKGWVGFGDGLGLPGVARLSETATNDWLLWVPRPGELKITPENSRTFSDVHQAIDAAIQVQPI